MQDSYRGFDALAEWVRIQRAEFEEFEVSLEEVLQDKEDALVIVERLWGKGRGSGAVAEMRVYAVYWFDDEGKMFKRRAFTSAEEALGAL